MYVCKENLRSQVKADLQWNLWLIKKHENVKNEEKKAGKSVMDYMKIYDKNTFLSVTQITFESLAS